MKTQLRILLYSNSIAQNLIFGSTIVNINFINHIEVEGFAKVYFTNII